METFRVALGIGLFESGLPHLSNSRKNNNDEDKRGHAFLDRDPHVVAADLEVVDPQENMELWKDGYQGDVIGEYTPNVLVTDFMKRERELIEQILQTEINIFRAIHDESALMQNMEDFYYITMLESVRSNYQTVASSRKNEQDSMSTS